MSDFYIGQIMMAGFDFAPRNFAQCSGQLMAIQQNQALFSLLGTTYGGNGVQTFALPDLRGRTPIGQSSNMPTGQVSGSENVTLLSTNVPAHTHSVQATSATGNSRNPRNNLFATEGSPALYASGATVPLNPATIGAAGGNQPHSNMQPYAATNFCIALFGIFPSRN